MDNRIHTYLYNRKHIKIADIVTSYIYAQDTLSILSQPSSQHLQGVVYSLYNINLNWLGLNSVFIITVETYDRTLQVLLTLATLAR